MSRQAEIRREVSRLEANIDQELQTINKEAECQMERQMELIRTLETHYKQLADRTAKDQAKAKQEMNELQRENRELRRELAEQVYERFVVDDEVERG